MIKPRLGTRLLLAFGGLLLCMLTLAGVGIWKQEQMVAASVRIAEVDARRERLLQDWRRGVELNGVRLQAILSATDMPAMAAVFKRDIADTTALVSAVQKELEPLLASAQAQAALERLAQARKRYNLHRDEAMALATGGTADGQARAAEAFRERLMPARRDYLQALDALMQQQRTVIDQSGDQAIATARNGTLLLEGLALVSMVAGIAIAVLTRRAIVTPLARSTALAEAVARGDLAQTLRTSRQDELGELQRGLARMVERLVQVIGNVRTSVEPIASAAGEIASGNQDLSARTERQAASLQQTASSMHQMASAVQQTAQNAAQGSQLARDATEVARRGGELVGQVVQTMGGINDSSRRITDITGVIDGIAFQTNILALNAAVEAARAGEQGRGFAVVASEVRTLAQRSAEAAREIKSLIGASVERVEAGTRLVDQAGATMSEIVDAIGRVNDIMGEITAATGEQSSGIALVSEAVSQMDHVTQQNAALVEQSAAAAQSLRMQSDQLVQAVSVFRLPSARAGG